MEEIIKKGKGFYEMFKIHFLNIKEPTQEELFCCQILFHALQDKDSQIVISLDSDEKAILWPNRGVYILMHHRHVTIVHNGENRNCFIENTGMFNEINNMFINRIEENLNMVREEINKSKEKFFENIISYI